MAKQFEPSIVTANHLLEGDVIYQTKTGWSRTFEEATVYLDEAEAEAQLAQAIAESDITVGAYLVKVNLENGRPTPAHFREAFRRTGPSNYFHGKQEAENANV